MKQRVVNDFEVVLRRMICAGVVWCVVVAALMMWGMDAAQGQQAVNANEPVRVNEHIMRGGWTPVDQTVSDYSPNATSQRMLQHGNSQFNRNMTMYERPVPLLQQRFGIPSRDYATGLYLPTQYQFRAPGVTAMVARPEYLVRTGTDPKKDVALNKQPFEDGLYADIFSANMVFVLDPAMTNPMIYRVDRRAGDGRMNPRVSLRAKVNEPTDFQQPGVVRGYDDGRTGFTRVNYQVGGRVNGESGGQTGSFGSRYYDPTVDGRFYSPVDRRALHDGKAEEPTE
ncbi:hypothetical protein [Poriferisphaera sp. WC338]|uniref:hypothetical protein n=1 Tax=Poriferisphaera sp. WC338 TaxID=3425129 RepID=UPI003D818343